MGDAAPGNGLRLGHELLAAPTVKDTAPVDEPFSVGENTPKVVGNNITLAGTGADVLSVTASVTKGTLSTATFSGGDAAAVSQPGRFTAIPLPQRVSVHRRAGKRDGKCAYPGGRDLLLTTEHEVAFKVIRRLHGGCL